MILEGTVHQFTGSPMDNDSLPFWALHCGYLVTLGHIEYGDKRDMALWAKELNIMKSTLAFQSERWKLAGMSLISNKCVLLISGSRLLSQEY